MGKTAFIFPGQGAQSVGMARDVAEASSRARAVFERADEILGFSLQSVCFEGPADQLERTDIQQPAIFVASVALWEALAESGVSKDVCSFAGGLSLGEYTALHFAGALAYDDALRLVRRRGELMQQAALEVPSGMVSLIGADEATAEALCEKAREGEVLAPANFNCPGQIVIAGSKGACLRAMELLGEFGVRGVQLAVAGAFHTSLMQPAADGLAGVLRETEITPPRVPVVSNVDGAYHGQPGAIREALERQVTHPVRWQRCVERLIADGADRFVEIGPGRVLAGLMRKIDRSVTVLNVSTWESVSAAVGQLPGG